MYARLSPRGGIKCVFAGSYSLIEKTSLSGATASKQHRTRRPPNCTLDSERAPQNWKICCAALGLNHLRDLGAPRKIQRLILSSAIWAAKFAASATKQAVHNPWG